jgi:hypothetical protein
MARSTTAARTVVTTRDQTSRAQHLARAEELMRRGAQVPKTKLSKGLGPAKTHKQG